VAGERGRLTEVMNANVTFDPGFRMSVLDVAFLLLVIAASPLLAQFFVQLAVAALVATLHFFLFCNVLRATRPLELLWAAFFIGLWSSAYVWSVPSWPYAYGLTLLMTLIVTVVQIRLPSYHGAFWAVLNPKLPQRWANQREAGV